MTARTAFWLIALGAVPLVGGLTGCVAGPASVAVGRAVYNEVINRTESEQLLNMIVHERYKETYGMLAVASVTASIRASADLHAEFGLSRTLKKDYDGNLVPLAGGVAFEENPTISYVPLGGEKFVQRLLGPLSFEEMLLMAEYVRHWRHGYLAIGINSINGLRNPRFTPGGTESTEFDRALDLWQHLRRVGVLRLARDPNSRFQVVAEVDDAEHEKALVELLELTRISKRPSDGRLVLPARVATDGWLPDAFNFGTNSVMAILRAAGNCIEIPESHLKAGIVEASVDRFEGRFMRIRTSQLRPRGEGTVAIQYRGRWYYVDDADPDSKQAFLFLRVLVGLRLHKPGQEKAPVLTIPVG